MKERIGSFKNKVYIRRPDDFSPAFIAVSVYIIWKGKILFLKRAETDKQQPGKWGVVNGNQRSGEDELDTLLREAFEESGLDLKDHASDFIFSKEYFLKYRKPEKFDFIGKTYVINLKSEPKEIKLSNEHEAYEWLTLVEALKREDLVSGLRYILLNYEKKLRKVLLEHASYQ